MARGDLQVGRPLEHNDRDGRSLEDVEPAAAAVLSGGEAGQHGIPRIGVGFVPQVLNREVVDEVIAVSDADAFEGTRRLAREEGIVAGLSSDAVHAALRIAERSEADASTIALLLAGTGERYLTYIHEGGVMRYMVIERFQQGARPIYERAAAAAPTRSAHQRQTMCVRDRVHVRSVGAVPSVARRPSPVSPSSPHLDVIYDRPADGQPIQPVLEGP